MRTAMTTLAAVLLGSWALGCTVPVATCADDDDCPGDLVCDATTGVCALAGRADRDAGDRRAQSEAPAPVDDAPSTDVDAPAEEPADEQPPADANGDDDVDVDGGGDGWGCWPDDDDDDDEVDEQDDGGSVDDADDADGGADDADEGATGDQQCLPLEEPCSFDDDVCCEHTHCCPVFLICVPNFWE